MGQFFKGVWKALFCFFFFLGLLTAKAIADDLSDGIAYYKEGEYTKAFGVVKRFAERGDTNAQFLLSHMYQTGKGIDPNDIIAGKWLHKAADEGHRDAQYEIALRYYQGSAGFEKNVTEAFFWFEKAAMQEHVRAQVMLGHCYLRGEGVPFNQKVALVWYEKAAKQGNEEAIRYLKHFHSENPE